MKIIDTLYMLLFVVIAAAAVFGGKKLLAFIQSPNNPFSTGANSIFQAVTGNKVDSIGTWAYGLTHSDPFLAYQDPNALVAADLSTPAAQAAFLADAQDPRAYGAVENIDAVANTPATLANYRGVKL